MSFSAENTIHGCRIKLGLKSLSRTKRVKSLNKLLLVVSQEIVDFAPVFTNITRRGALPVEASIHTAEMSAIKISLKRR